MERLIEKGREGDTVGVRDNKRLRSPKREMEGRDRLEETEVLEIQRGWVEQRKGPEKSETRIKKQEGLRS